MHLQNSRREILHCRTVFLGRAQLYALICCPPGNSNGGGGNQVILSLSLMKVHSEMWEGRRWSLTSGCLAYQHPAAGEVTGFRREPELMMAIENAEATYWPGSMGIEG